MFKAGFILSLERVIIITGILLFFILSLKHWNFFFVPNIDIYQYLCEARIYYQGAFPNFVHPQPLYSLLIFPVSILFSSFNYPEIKAGIAINLLSTTFSLYLLWLLSKRYLSAAWRMLLMILVITHPLVFYTAVNTTPEAFLLLFVLSALVFYPSKANLAYLFAMLAAFVKYEGYVVVAMLVLTDALILFQQNNIQETTRSKLKRAFASRTIALISIACLVIWQVITFSHNYQVRGAANYYFEEIQETVQPLPDWRKTSRLIDLLQAHPSIYNTSNEDNDLFEMVILVTMLGIVGYKSYQKGQWPLFQSVGFCAGYLLIHTFFPAYSPRYFTPILSFMFLYLCILLQYGTNLTQKYKYAISLVISALVIGWIFDLWNYKYDFFMVRDKYLQAEERLAGDWLNNFTVDEEHYAILTTDGQSISNYIDGSKIKNPFKDGIMNRPLCEGYPFSINSNQSKISFYTSTYLSSPQCNSAMCLVELLPSSFNKIFVIHSSNSDFTLSEYELETGCFEKITTLTDGDPFMRRFVNIYEFQKDICI